MPITRIRDMLHVALGRVLVLIGVLDCAVAAGVLVNVSATTDAWVLHATDPEFLEDRTLFLRAAVVASVLLAACGVVTIRQVVRVMRAQRPSWLVLMIGAPLVHWAWLLVRVIGRGDLSEAGQRVGLQRDLTVFIIVCGAYVAAWLVTRRMRLRLAS